MYDTLVNFQSGPRILDQSLEMIAVDPAKAPLFDHLSTTSFGYGGDPYDVTFLNFSKGRIYDFHSSFRRNRQYFDDNLLANPLIPPTSTPFVPILDTPHLYNTAPHDRHQHNGGTAFRGQRTFRLLPRCQPRANH